VSHACPICRDTGRVTHHQKRGKNYVKVPNHPCFCEVGKKAAQEDGVSDQSSRATGGARRGKPRRGKRRRA
jgi:hypothetical protein